MSHVSNLLFIKIHELLRKKIQYAFSGDNDIEKNKYIYIFFSSIYKYIERDRQQEVKHIKYLLFFITEFGSAIV